MDFAVNFAIGFISLILGVYGTILTYRSMQSHREKDWTDVLKSIDNLHEHLQKDGIEFDYIAGFPDGGLIVADLLHIKHRQRSPVLAIPIIKTPAKRGPKELSVPPGCLAKEFLHGKKILVVDDVVRSGRTMDVALKFLTQEMGIVPENIYTAALGRNKGTDGFMVDYYDFDYEGEFYLPWGKVSR